MREPAPELRLTAKTQRWAAYHAVTLSAPTTRRAECDKTDEGRAARVRGGKV